MCCTNHVQVVCVQVGAQINWVIILPQLENLNFILISISTGTRRIEFAWYMYYFNATIYLVDQFFLAVTYEIMVYNLLFRTSCHLRRNRPSNMFFKV